MARTKQSRLPVHEALFDLGIFALTIGLLLLLRFQVAPTLGPVTYQAGQEVKTGHFPLFFDATAPTMTASFPVQLQSLRPGIFAVQVDDCIEEMRVNGVAVVPDQISRFCSPHELTHVNLRPYLHAGKNEVSVSISDIGVTEGLHVTVSNTDPLFFTLWLGILLCIAWYVFRLRLLLPSKLQPPNSLLWLLLFAVFIRLLYIGATPYTLRTHDLEGHLDYIEYVREHKSVPPAKDGWEFHQPPLYYALAGGWLESMSALSVPERMALQSLSGWSVALSVAAFVIAFLAAGFLFSPSERRLAAAYAVILAVYTGFVFFAPRITNEALSAPLTLACMVLLLLWWRKSSDRLIFLLAVTFALGFLTKISILALAPAICMTILAHTTLSLRARLMSLSLFSFAVFAVAGWYPAHRLFLEPDTEKTLTLGNNGMDDGLMVQRDARHLLTFNPVAVLHTPFNDSWSQTSRRDNLPEYFYRSSLFGEYQFKKLRVIAQLMLGFGMFLLPVFLIGFIREIAKNFRPLLPLHLSTLCLLLAAVAYPFFFPYAPNQDFRFSVALVLPIAYYTVRGINAFPKYLRLACWVAFGLFCASSTAFIAALFLRS